MKKPTDVCQHCGEMYSSHYTPYDFAVPNCPIVIDGSLKYSYKWHFKKENKMTQFKVGDKVVDRTNPNEYGTVVELANSGKTVRVDLQPPYSKLWWYDVKEIELIN